MKVKIRAPCTRQWCIKRSEYMGKERAKRLQTIRKAFVQKTKWDFSVVLSISFRHWSLQSVPVLVSGV